MAKRGAGLPDLESAAALEHGIENGHGGVWLNLTPAEDAKLKTKGWDSRTGYDFWILGEDRMDKSRHSPERPKVSLESAWKRIVLNW